MLENAAWMFFLLAFYYLDFQVYIFMSSFRVLSFFTDRAHSSPVILDSFLVLVHVYVIYVHWGICGLFKVFFSLKRKFCKYSKNWMNGKCLNARLMIKSTVLISGYFCFFVTCSLLDLSYICLFSSKRFTTKPFSLFL